MPASEAQILANQANAARSSGPRSEAGRARSRLNATKHGMASQSAAVEATRSPEFEERRAKWAAEQNPVGEAGNWAMDRVIASTFRIERCEHTINEIITEIQQRATLVWDQDRAVEAATIAGRLAKDPVLASRQLQTTWAGVGLLIEAWLGLAAALETGDWSESEASKALDLLGVAPDLRSCRTLIDAPVGSDPVAFHRTLAIEEIDRLEELRDQALAPLDEMERRRAMVGQSALLSKQAKLVLRYEREAWKHYWDSMKELKAQAPPTVAVAPPPPPAVVAPPPPVVVAPPPPVVVAPPQRPEPSNRLVAMGLADDDEWLEALDRRTERRNPLPGSYVPIAMGVRASGG
jgi:hypothetical protein